MATAALKPCKQPCCPALVKRGEGYCPKHQTNNSSLRQRREYDRQRNQQDHRAIYKTARWSRVRMMKLRQDPFCQLADVCVRRTGHPAVATVVDHIKSTAEAPELAYDMDNLRSACKPCHDARTARDQGFAKTKEPDSLG
jgi:5-methylcytosine-specific restriction protein A